MLCLSRKKNETICLTGEITVMVLEIRGDKVRLGIQALQDVEIFRGEIWAAKYGGTEPCGGQSESEST